MEIRTKLTKETAPKYYTSTDYLFVGGSYDMWTHNGNCTHYAYARTSEIICKNCKGIEADSFPNAGLWLNVTKWETGTTPKQGAIGVCENHVFIVEEVYEDGSYLVSDSSYEDYIFKSYKKSTKVGKSYAKVSGKLKGFIYNPYVVEPTTITTDQALTKMAQDVLKGMYGNGTRRKDNLYTAIQRKVNELCS